MVQLQGGVRVVHHAARRRRDAEAGAVRSELQEIENNLPIDPKFRNPKLGALAPIRVVNTVFSSGDGNRGVQTAAYNLPNDERVITEKGSKRVMLKNNQEAKFRVVLQPIAKVALSAADQANVAFDAFFTHILMHELMHGLGPHNITVGGRATTVRQELKELYSTIEEAKADVSGLFALQFLVDHGKLDKQYRADDVHDVPGVDVPVDPLRPHRGARARRGDAAQLLPRPRRRDAWPRTARSRWTTAKIKQNVIDLTRDLMTMQAIGDYAAAKQMVDDAGEHPPAGAGGARQAEGRAGRHRAALRDGRRAVEVTAAVKM